MPGDREGELCKQKDETEMNTVSEPGFPRNLSLRRRAPVLLL